MENSFERLIALLRSSLMGFRISEQLFASMTEVDWEELFTMAKKQGVAAIAFDAIEKMQLKMPKTLLLKWFAVSSMIKNNYVIQEKSACKLADLWAENGIKTVVMKGIAFAHFYPKPLLRQCGDADVYLIDFKDTSVSGHQKAYERGNLIVEQHGVKVNRDYYKNSSFCFEKLHVENHCFCTQIRGSKRSKNLEVLLENLLLNSKSEKIGNYSLEKPCVMFNALFLIEHARNHFLREGIELRHVCDWLMFKNMYQNQLDEVVFAKYCQEYGLTNFLQSMNHLADMIATGDMQYFDENDELLLNDILSDKTYTSSESFNLKGRLVLVRETFKNVWKYRKFSEISMLGWLWQSTWGYFFDRKPNLNG